MAEIGEITACFSIKEDSSKIDFNYGIFTGLDEKNYAKVLSDTGENLKNLKGDLLFVGNHVILALKPSNTFLLPSCSFVLAEITKISKERLKASKQQEVGEHVVLTTKIKHGVGKSNDFLKELEGKELVLGYNAGNHWNPLSLRVINLEVFRPYQNSGTVGSLPRIIEVVVTAIPKEDYWVYFLAPSRGLKTMYQCASVFIERSNRFDSCTLKVFSKDIHQDGKSYTIQPGRNAYTHVTGLNFYLPYQLETNGHKEILTMDKLSY